MTALTPESEVVPCYGPLAWHSIGDPEDAALLECNADGCDYLIATGSFNDARHADTPVAR